MKLIAWFRLNLNVVLWCGIVLFAGICASAELVAVNDSPGADCEWEFSPADGCLCSTNPPGFVWRPQNNAASYEIQCAQDAGFKKVGYSAKNLEFNTVCPECVFAVGQWYWRYRFYDSQGNVSAWSKVRSFTLNNSSVSFPMLLSPAPSATAAASPDSIWFKQSGRAVLNSDIAHTENNVQVVFSSGTRDASDIGYTGQNAFVLYAFGRKLLLNSGIESTDNGTAGLITVNGKGQSGLATGAEGRITGFHTSREMDFVAGQAAQAYPPGILKSFARNIIFINQPSIIVVIDYLSAPSPALFRWYLNAPGQFDIKGNTAAVENSGAACKVTFIRPPGLALSGTSDVGSMGESLNTSQCHLSAGTGKAAADMLFVTLIQVYRAGNTPAEVSCAENAGRMTISNNRFSVTINAADDFSVTAGGKRFEIKKSLVTEK